MIKKINSVISLLCCLCLLAHFGTMTYSMQTGYYNYILFKGLARMTAVFVSVHVILVLILLFVIHDGSRLKRYKKQNLRVILQRLSGLLIIVLLPFHVKNYGFIMSDAPFVIGEKIRICFMEMIYFFAVFAHVATSFSRAFITLGIITDEKSINRLDTTARVLCIIFFLLTTFTMIRYVISF